jgi:hypothetical protein
MGQPKLNGMHIVNEITAGEELDLFMSFLVSDPAKITLYIQFWRSELQNATDENKAEIQKMLDMWLEIAKNQTKFNHNVYTFNYGNESGVEKKKNEFVDNKKAEQARMVHQPANASTDDPSKENLKVVSVNGEDVAESDTDKALRTKYADIIKVLNYDELLTKTKKMMTDGLDIDAIEMATFILSKGLYKGKKAKPQAQDRIDKFIEACKPKVEDTTDEDEQTNLADEKDLNKRFANYLGEKAPTIATLRAEVKCLFGEGKAEQAVSLATFILTNGHCSDDKNKWTDLRVETWMKEIKEELANPDKAVKPVFEISSVDMYANIKKKILEENMSEEDLKKFIFDTITTKKVELVADLCSDPKPTQAQLEDAYVRYYLSYVANQYDEKKNKSLDIKEEIIKMVKKCKLDKEKGLSGAISKAMILYAKRGEKPGIKEVQKIVYSIADEIDPEYYKEVMANLNKSKETKTVTVVDAKEIVPFDKKYPDIWDLVKDCKTLDELHKQAVDLEKIQDFTVVQAMIIHSISSGNIKDAEKQPDKWDLAQIELWINTMFQRAETPAEAADKAKETNPTPPATDMSKTTPGAGTETVDTANSTKGASETAKTITDESANGSSTETADTTKTVNEKCGEDLKNSLGSAPGATTNQDTNASTATQNGQPATTVTENVGAAEQVKNGTEEKNADLVFKTWATVETKESFDKGFVENVTRLMKEKKSKVEIIHEISDVIFEISREEKFKNSMVHNFANTKLSDIYKAVDRKCLKLTIEGWTELV